MDVRLESPGERDRPGRTAARLAPPILNHVLGETPRTAGETPALPKTFDPKVQNDSEWILNFLHDLRSGARVGG